MAPHDDQAQGPQPPPQHTLVPLDEVVAQLRAALERSNAPTISLPEIEQRLYASVREAILSHGLEIAEQQRPTVHVEVIQASKKPLLAVLLSRLKTGLYALSGLGFTLVLGGAVSGVINNTTVALGLLASLVAALTGLVLELIEKSV